MEYYQRLKDCREDKDLTQNDIAIILNTTPRQYSRWETGFSPLPVEILIKLAKIYSVSTDYILGLSNNKSPNK